MAVFPYRPPVLIPSRFVAVVICGDTAFLTQQIGFACGSPGIFLFNLSNVDMSGVGGNGVYAPHTSIDFGLLSNNTILANLNNCKFGAPTVFYNKPAWSKIPIIAARSTIRLPVIIAPR